MERDNAKHGKTLAKVPKELWPRVIVANPPIEVWRSKDFLVQVFQESFPGVQRMTACRTSFARGGYVDGISWEQLQTLKRECGRGDKDAVEIYPADDDVVNIANMRHLFIFDQLFPLTWRNKAREREIVAGGKE